MILALETATNVCSVVFCDDEGSMHEYRTEQRGSHSEKLFLSVQELQKEHGFSIPDLDAMIVGEGPGSYTGLRISASAVKGFLFQTNVPLYGVNTLASFAMQAVSENPDAKTIHSIIDARRVHIYHQKYSFSDGKLRSEDKIEVLPIENFENMLRAGDTVIGTGLNRIDQEIIAKAQSYDADKITAKSLVRLYQEGWEHFYYQADPESFEPKYYTSNQVG